MANWAGLDADTRAGWGSLVAAEQEARAECAAVFSGVLQHWEVGAMAAGGVVHWALGNPNTIRRGATRVRVLLEDHGSDAVVVLDGVRAVARGNEEFVDKSLNWLGERSGPIVGSVSTHIDEWVGCTAAGVQWAAKQSDVVQDFADRSVQWLASNWQVVKVCICIRLYGGRTGQYITSAYCIF